MPIRGGSVRVDIKVNMSLDVEVNIEQMIEDQLIAMGLEYTDFDIIQVSDR